MFKTFALYSVFFLLLASSPKISKNIYINDINIGKMQKAEALSHLEAVFGLDSKEIVIIYGDTRKVYSFSVFGAFYDFEAALNEAIEYSSGNIFKKIYNSISLKFEPKHIQLRYSFDEQLVQNIVHTLANELYIAPIDAEFYKMDGNFVTIDGKNGQKIDPKPVIQQISQALSDKTSAEIEIEIMPIAPTLAAEDFSESRQLLGSYYTDIQSLSENRNINTKIASDNINNSIVLPGEVFSTSRAMKERTAQNGYLPAGVIVNGEPTEDLGGGVCQISSTLYMAALYAEQEIIERRPHSLMVGYTPPATDAAIAEGLIDLKFKNTTDRPILIESLIQNNQHVVNIYGKDNRDANRLISFEIIELDRLEGDKFGILGGTYELYKIINENGIIQRQKINKSTYKPL